MEKLVWTGSTRNTEKVDCHQAAANPDWQKILQCVLRCLPDMRNDLYLSFFFSSRWSLQDFHDSMLFFFIAFWWDIVLIRRSCWAWLAHYSGMSVIFPLTWCCFAAAAGSTHLHFPKWWSHFSFWRFTPAVLWQQRPVKQMFLSHWWTEKWLNQLKVLNEFILQCQLLTKRFYFKVLWRFKLYS